MNAKADAKTLLLEQIRIAERMAEAIYQLSASKDDLDGQTKQTLIYWSTRAKAALRNAQAIIEGESHDSPPTSGAEGGEA